MVKTGRTAGVSSHWQKIVKGIIIVIAVLIDVKGRSRKN